MSGFFELVGLVLEVLSLEPVGKAAPAARKRQWVWTLLSLELGVLTALLLHLNYTPGLLAPALSSLLLALPLAGLLIYALFRLRQVSNLSIPGFLLLLTSLTLPLAGVLRAWLN